MATERLPAAVATDPQARARGESQAGLPGVLESGSCRAPEEAQAGGDSESAAEGGAASGAGLEELGKFDVQRPLGVILANRILVEVYLLEVELRLSATLLAPAAVDHH